jgi:hypothetical protein
MRLLTECAMGEAKGGWRPREVAMPTKVKFQPAWVAGGCDCEQARVVCVNGCLVAILLRVADPDLPRDRRGWYLELGFGPCRGEGVLFRNLQAAEAWVRARLPPDWAARCKERSMADLHQGRGSPTRAKPRRPPQPRQ